MFVIGQFAPISRLSLVARSIGVAVAVAASPAFAQGALRFPSPESISFERLFHAERTQHFSVTLLREALQFAQGGQGSFEWIRVTEQLRIAPRATEDGLQEAWRAPHFNLSFENAVSRNLTPTQHSERAVRYARDSAFLFLHATMLVQNPVLAAKNYSIAYLAPSFRLGRAAHQVAVIPLHGDRSTWLWEIDAETGFPLTQTEFSSTGLRVSSLSAIHFAHGSEVEAMGRPTDGWDDLREDLQIFDHADEAASAFPDYAIQTPSLDNLPVGFHLVQVHVVREPLQPAIRHISTYSDGLDQVLLRQRLVNLPPEQLSVSTSVRNRRDPSIAIERFQDLHTVQLRYDYGAGSHCFVVGRAALSLQISNWTRDIVLSLASL